jgi:hypothetical protein
MLEGSGKAGMVGTQGQFKARDTVGDSRLLLAAYRSSQVLVAAREGGIMWLAAAAGGMRFQHACVRA